MRLVIEHYSRWLGTYKKFQVVDHSIFLTIELKNLLCIPDVSLQTHSIPQTNPALDEFNVYRWIIFCIVPELGQGGR